MPDRILAIDVGTSACKVALVDVSGVAPPLVKRAPYRSERSGPATDPAVWWGAIAATIQGFSDGERREVVAVGVTGQMHTIVPVGPRTTPLCDAIGWFDRARHATTPSLTNVWARARGRLLNGATGAYTVEALAWLQTVHPDITSRVDCFLFAKDWVGAMLTGQYTTETTDASASGMWNFEDDRFDSAVLAALAIEPDLLPPVKRSTAVRGELQTSAAADLGLPVGIPVVCGYGDVAATIRAVGGIEEGSGVVIVSTGAQVIIRAEPAPHLPLDDSQIYAGPDGVPHYRMVGLHSGGRSVEHALATLGADWDEGVRALAGTSLGSQGVICASPSADPVGPDLSSLGLAWISAEGASRLDLLRSCFESLVFQCFEALRTLEAAGKTKVSRIVLVGYPSRHLDVRSLFAAVLGVEVEAPPAYLGAWTGAVHAAADALGVRVSWPFVRLEGTQVMVPDPTVDGTVEDLAERRRQLARHIAPTKS